MERKEVIVAGKVFNLGLKGLDDAIVEGERDGRTITLEVGTKVFQVDISRPDRAFIVHRCGMTNMRNVIWHQFVMLRFRWPPAKSLSCFTFAKEDIYV